MCALWTMKNPVVVGGISINFVELDEGIALFLIEGKRELAFQDEPYCFFLLHAGVAEIDQFSHLRPLLRGQRLGQFRSNHQFESHQILLRLQQPLCKGLLLIALLEGLLTLQQTVEVFVAAAPCLLVLITVVADLIVHLAHEGVGLLQLSGEGGIGLSNAEALSQQLKAQFVLLLRECPSGHHQQTLTGLQTRLPESHCPQTISFLHFLRRLLYLPQTLPAQGDVEQCISLEDCCTLRRLPRTLVGENEFVCVGEATQGLLVVSSAGVPETHIEVGIALFPNAFETFHYSNQVRQHLLTNLVQACGLCDVCHSHQQSPVASSYLSASTFWERLYFLSQKQQYFPQLLGHAGQLVTSSKQYVIEQFVDLDQEAAGNKPVGLLKHLSQSDSVGLSNSP